MMKSNKASIIAGFGLLLAAFIWGVAFVVVKTALDVIPPMYMLAFRFTIAAISLLIVFHKRIKKISGDLIINGMILGILLFMGYMLQTIGCKYTTAGKNAFLTTIYVVLVPFLNWLIFKWKPNPYCIAAAFLALLGIALLSLDGSLRMNIGDILSILCGFAYAMHMVYIDKFTKIQDPILLTLLQVVFVGLISWAAALLFEGSFPMGVLQADSIGSMLYLGLLSTMVCFLLQNVGQKYTQASTAALLLSMESVFGALSGVILLGERMNIKMIAGCIFIFIAVIMAETKLSFIKTIRNKLIGRFYPDYYITSAYAINYQKWYAKGMRGILFDIDNTLVSHGARADKRAIDLIAQLKKIGFRVCLISNNREERVKLFNDDVQVCYIYKANKPSRKNYRKAMDMIETTVDTTIFIGDQLFTDIFGAKRTGITTILVSPIHPKEEIQIVLKRYLEKFVLYYYQKDKTDIIRTASIKNKIEDGKEIPEERGI